jgi:NAD(P)-dependent dehydrogenase (short-subunit alcohol dehydrogenase family)
VTTPPESADAARALEFLEGVAKDRARLAELDQATRERLVKAAGALLYPDASAKRALSKAFRKKDRVKVKANDAEALETTGMRSLRRAKVFLPPPSTEPLTAEAPRVAEARTCYVCKAAYTTLHGFYDQLCPSCGDFNYQKRGQTADLHGRTALVTGARVKIGFFASLMLLRSGARVVVTTRFPHDAALRYAREPDFEAWRDRLVLYGLDLRHTPSVETFCAHLAATEARLDYVIHNACQTVRRPAGFYAHLLEGEQAPLSALPPGARGTLEAYDGLRRSTALAKAGGAHAAGLTQAPELSQALLLAEDAYKGGALFPEGLYDADLQQQDHRAVNSWRLTLAEVPTIELLEVQLVNAVAPFVMNARLKGLMLKTPGRDKHIVNVSAMEGQFYRTFKTDKHPHTNMAKAALNMMTRTSAPDYVKDGIHMNSVDTGWVTDEDPVQHAERKAGEGFRPPLDVVDGAARIVDPILHGTNTGEHLFGLFLKDYKAVAW